MQVSMDPGIWVSVAFILFTWSYLIKETPIYRFAEHTMIGVTAGIMTVYGLKNVLDIALTPLITGESFIGIIPLVLGILLYARYSTKYRYLSRYMIAIIVGVGAGITLRAEADSNFMVQLISTVTAPLTNMNNIVKLIATVTVIFYFIFTGPEHKGTPGIFAKIARYFMMITFGAMFGNTIMFRISLLIGSLQTILYDFLGLMPT